VRRSRPLLIGVIALVSFIAFEALDRLQPFAYVRVRNFYRDALARAGRKTPANVNLVFLAIDSDSVGLDSTTDLEQMFGISSANPQESRALRLMTQRWPWPREVYGLILSRLVEAGARVVLFDLTFPTATDGDEPFRLALERYKDHVVVGSNFVSASSRGFAMSSASHTRPPDSLIPQTTPVDDRVAYTNFWPDEDDVVRRAQYRVTFEQVEGGAADAKSERFLSLGARGLMKAGFADAIPAGLDDHAFRFTAGPRLGFPPRSVFEIFVPDYWQHNYRDGEFFRDKIVVIGAEGNWQHDEHPTPFGSMPGPEVHLNAINAALHREFINEMSPAVVLLLTVVAGAIAVVLSLFVGSPWLRLGMLFLLNAAAIAVALAAFNYASVYLPWVAPGAQLNITVLLGLVADFGFERVEKARVRRTLERYVSRNVVTELLGSYTESLGGVVKTVSVLFSDIRGYSIVSARSNPQALVAQLNEYLTAMVDCVFRHGGTLDKFIGDAVMAVWGNTHSEGPAADATNAVRAADDMRKALARLNADWRARGLPEFRVGVAVNNGPVVVGNIGSPQRMEFTVVGETVNTTWRLQELTKQLGCDLLIGKRAAELLDGFDIHSLGVVRIRDGAPIEVFSLADEAASADEPAELALAAT
jgi:adenylate cyclase